MDLTPQGQQPEKSTAAIDVARVDEGADDTAQDSAVFCPDCHYSDACFDEQFGTWHCLNCAAVWGLDGDDADHDEDDFDLPPMGDEFWDGQL